MNLPQANYVIPPTLKEPRHCEVVIDGKRYHGKGTRCSKRPQTHNPMWIVNECTYHYFATKAGLRMPDCMFFRVESETYFGSEKLDNRKVLGKQPFNPDQHDNRRQLTLALLLDLFLLNSDRTPQNVLLDDVDSLWFFDHDKSLWGDGLPETHPKQNGDLGRLDVAKLPEKQSDYLSDYLGLRFRDATSIVFGQQPWVNITECLVQMPTDYEQFELIRDLLPDPTWLSNELIRSMKAFARVWWSLLRDYFEQQNDGLVLLQLLHSLRYKRGLD